jgi:hypothetical protein
MNNAGLPGTGIGGLFYILLALWMPVAEVGRALRGQSDPGRWRQVLTQFALACGVVVAVGGTVAGYLYLVGAPRVLGVGGVGLAVAPIALAALLLSVLVVGLRIWARCVRPRWLRP